MTNYFNDIKMSFSKPEMPEQFSKAWEKTQAFCGRTFTPFWQDKVMPFWDKNVVAGWNDTVVPGWNNTVVPGWNKAVEDHFPAIAVTILTVSMVAARTITNIVLKMAAKTQVYANRSPAVQKRINSSTAATIFALVGNGSYVLLSHLRDTPMTREAFAVVTVSSIMLGSFMGSHSPKKDLKKDTSIAA